MNIEQYVEDRAMLDSDERVVVKELWDGRYRVNVWRHEDGIPHSISRSYFIRVNDSGVYCNPSLGA